MKKSNDIWKAEVTIDPTIEWEKMNLGVINLSQHESISLEKQLDNKTILSVTLVEESQQAKSDRATLLVKSVISLIELEANNKYEIHVGFMKPLNPIPPVGGWALVGGLGPITIGVKKDIGEYDLGFIRTMLSAIKSVEEKDRNRILRILNSLYDGLTAPADVHCYLSIYTGMNILTSGVGQQGNTVLSDATTLLEFVHAGILDVGTAKSWLTTLHALHSEHYDVLKTNKVTEEQMVKIKRFFKELLGAYIRYLSRTQ